MLFDSHAHLNFKAFDQDRDAVIRKCLLENIWMINVGTDAESSKKAVEIAHMYEKGVYAAVGVHPIRSDDSNGAIHDEEYDWATIEALAKDEKVVAIGETGLDYYHSQEMKNVKIKMKNGEDSLEVIKNKQKELFIKHIELAQQVHKPLIIHCRDAHADLFEILKAKSYNLKASPGVMHFFTGTTEDAKRYLELGLYVSFSGVITFTKDYDEVVKMVPLEKMLIETDAPFVAPAPFRGKRNEPSYVKYTAQRIAEIKGTSFEKGIEQTTKNAKKLFRV